MQVSVESSRTLRFDDGTPVRAASALAPFGGGWLVAQDDAVHAAWVVGGQVRRLRLLPPVEGHDVFADVPGRTDGTKHLKPDLEAGCAVRVEGEPAVLLLGSGSTASRRRAVLVTGGADPAVRAVDLTALSDAVAAALGVPDGQLNLEGAAVVGGVLRWFQRGNLPSSTPSSSVDVDLARLLEVVQGAGGPADVPLAGVRHYALGDVRGIGLATTDAVVLPDGRLLLSAAAEDTLDPVDDGEVVASALVLVDGDQVVEVVALPELDGAVQKVEGLTLLESQPGAVRLLAVVDADDVEATSVELTLRVTDLPPHRHTGASVLRTERP